MEKEAKKVLGAASAVGPAPASDLATRIRGRFAGLGVVQLSLPVREMVRAPPDFSESPKARKTIDPWWSD
jgi:antitoxin FitA